MKPFNQVLKESKAEKKIINGVKAYGFVSDQPSDEDVKYFNSMKVKVLSVDKSLYGAIYVAIKDFPTVIKNGCKDAGYHAMENDVDTFIKIYPAETKIIDEVKGIMRKAGSKDY